MKSWVQMWRSFQMDFDHKQDSVLAIFFLFWKVHNKAFPSRHKDVVTTLMRRRYPTSLWRRHIAAMEKSGDVAKTTSFQRLIKRRHNETLQQRRSCNVIWRFHCNYMATSERRRKRCNILVLWIANIDNEIVWPKIHFILKSFYKW